MNEQDRQAARRVAEATAYALAHPVEAAHERQREESLYRLAAVLAVPFKTAEEAAPQLCEEFGLSLEGLYRKLAAGDDAVWAKAHSIGATSKGNNR